MTSLQHWLFCSPPRHMIQFFNELCNCKSFHSVRKYAENGILNTFWWCLVCYVSGQMFHLNVAHFELFEFFFSWPFWTLWPPKCRYFSFFRLPSVLCSLSRILGQKRKFLSWIPVVLWLESSVLIYPRVLLECLHNLLLIKVQCRSKPLKNSMTFEYFRERNSITM